MTYKVFIDGQTGTTGLRLASRLETRPELELLQIEERLRKDVSSRLACIREADISFLCLPDEGAREIAAAASAPANAPGGQPRIIDASTAHRVMPGWLYGMPELVEGIGAAAYVANPGCHATGFILSVRPLVDAGIVRADAQLAVHSLTGYSGGGKAMIAEYEAADGASFSAPRQYALAQNHKHLPEMQKYAGLAVPPLFAPIVANFYSGMLVSVPLPKCALAKSVTSGEVRELLAERYEACPLVRVRPLGYESAAAAGGGFLAANAFANRDDLEIIITGNDDRIEIISRYDNLGKGAAGAAIQNMNRMLGLPEDAGLIIGE